MKQRIDFVSNSSSSSFMVKKASDLLKLLTDLGEIPYQLADQLRFRVYVKWKNYPEVYEFIKGEKFVEPHYDSNTYWRGSQYKWTPPEPDYVDTIWDIDINQLVSISKDDSEHVLDKLEGIEIQTDDNYDQGALAVLSMLYEYFKIKGLEPDDSNSEVDFRKDSNNFLVNLVTSLIQSKEG